jgi:hypothetical protein
MLAELTDYMKTANTPGTIVSAPIMVDMFINENNPFQDEELNNSDKQIRDKTNFLDQANIENLMVDFAIATSLAPEDFVQPGSPGVILSEGGTKQYFFDENGMEHIQLIEKGLMGSLLYHQITSVYLTDSKIGPSVDNTNVIPGKGTDMEHHWDEAFGYLGLPEDYPTNTEDVRFLGKYIHAREPLMQSGTKIMNAIIAGRFAITENDMQEKDIQAEIVISELEKAMGGTGIYYINSAMTNITDAALRNHALSEAIAFIRALKFNDGKSIVTQDIDRAIELIGDDLNNVSTDDLIEARTIIANALGLSDIADSL